MPAHERARADAVGRPWSFAFLLPLVVGLLVGLGYPFVDLALACRVPASEACVWGKAWLPLTLVLSVVLLGVPTGGIVYAAIAWARKRKARPDSE